VSRSEPRRVPRPADFASAVVSMEQREQLTARHSSRARRAGNKLLQTNCR